MIPEGRILIDAAKSFVYAESGLKGVLMASRLTGLSPHLTSRFTPGTLISIYELHLSTFKNRTLSLNIIIGKLYVFCSIDDFASLFFMQLYTTNPIESR